MQKDRKAIFFVLFLEIYLKPNKPEAASILRNIKEAGRQNPF
jgi:hypothetical protein